MAVNDTDQPWTGTVDVIRADLDGTVLAKGSLTLEAAARSTATLALPDRLVHPAEPTREVLVVETAAGHARCGSSPRTRTWP